MSRIHFLDVPIDLLSMPETVDLAVDAMRTRKLTRHVALNVAKFVTMRKDAELRRDVVESDIVGIDGMGIITALWFLGQTRAERVPGVDLMEALLDRCAKDGFRPFILGARRSVLDEAMRRVSVDNPTLVFAGSRDGYFKPDEEAAIVADIAASGADCLFVAMPTPRKERFLHRYAKDLNVPFIMGVGGSVDVLAGHVRRAPHWMQSFGLEWLFRLLQEPRRMFWRYISTNFVFLGILVSAFAGRVIGRTAIRRG